MSLPGRLIPETGRASLHLGDGAAQISYYAGEGDDGDGKRTAELRSYIRESVAAATTTPDFVYRHNWAARDLIIWWGNDHHS